MSKIKIGVMGCASIAKRLFIPAILSCNHLELLAVASRSLPELDAVYIPLPTGLHYKWIIKALQAGKHVIAEKSLAHDYDLVKLLVGEARRLNLVLFENFQFKYHSQFEFVKQQIQANSIGKIRCFRSSFGFPPFTSDNIRYKRELGGGSLLDAGAYTLKASQIFLGKNLEVLAASLQQEPENEVDIAGSAMLRNNQGIISQVSFGFDNFYQCNIEIWGSLGKITMERAFTAGPGFKPKVVIEKQDERYEFLLASDNHFVNILDDFSLAITSGDTNRQLDENLDQARMIQEIKTNAAN